MIAAAGLFLKGLPWRWIALAAAVAVCLGFTYHLGVKHEQGAQAKRVAAAQAKVKKTDDKAKVITADVSGKAEVAKAETRIVYRDIIKEVPRYVTVEADAKCVVPVGFVRLHDAAAAGRLPGVAGSTGEFERPSGIALSSVIGTVADNYHTAQDWRIEAEAWREWYQRQAANR